MRVPLLDLQRQHEPLRAELHRVFRDVLDSGAYILGPEVEKLEHEIAAICGARHGIALSSGTDALLLALMALDIGPGDEVICPSFTFFATASTIARLGATPVFVDVEAATFHTTAALVRPLITPRTRAIIPVHLFGQSANMTELMALAAEHGLAVIEDAAQALGAAHRGRPVGSFGAINTLSFYPTKNLGAMGDAGMVLTSDDELARKAKMLRNHGSDRRYYHAFLGGNFRCDGLQAAFLRAKLPSLPWYQARRQEHAAFYTERLRALAGDHGEEALLTLPMALPENKHVWNQYTLRVGRGRRDALKAWLAGQGVASEIYYPLPLDAQDCFRHLPPARDRLPVTYQLAGEALSIPVFPELLEEERQHVAQSLIEWLKNEGTAK